MRQGIIPGISQIAGLELTYRVYALAADDENPAGLTGVVQHSDDRHLARTDGQTTSNGAPL